MTARIAALALVLHAATASAAADGGAAFDGAVPAEAHAEAAPPQHATVVFGDEPLFDLTAPIGKLDVPARARAIEARLQAAAAGEPALVHVEGTDVLVGQRVVLSTTDDDALTLGKPRAILASERAARIDAALQRDYHDRSLRGILRGSAYAAGTTLALVALLWLLVRGFRRLEAILVRFSAHQLDRRAAWLDSANIVAALSALARLLRTVAVVVVLLFYTNLVLDFFPWTRGIATLLFGYLRAAVVWAGRGIVSYLPNVAYIVVTIVAVRFVLKVAAVVFNALERKTLVVEGFHADWAAPSYKIVRFLVLAMSAVIIFPYLPGASSPAFRGISVFLGVLFSLGSASSVGNLLSGVVITYMRPFQLGDRVQLADTVGDIVDKNLLVVRVRTVKNVEVTIPNALVLANHIVNFTAPTREGTLIVHTSVTIGYDAPWRRVHELLVAAATRTEGLLREPAPYVLQRALDDFYVEYEINAHTRSANAMAQLHAHLHEHIQDTFNAAGVEIMSPHFTAARDGNRMAIPDASLPAGYEAPAFRIRDARKP